MRYFQHLITTSKIINLPLAIVAPPISYFYHNQSVYNYFYNKITSPLSMLIERYPQAYESYQKIRKTFEKKFYEEVATNVIFKDASNYYDDISIKIPEEIKKIMPGIKFNNGQVLENSDPRFGEWSGMDFDGDNLILISDRGAYFRFSNQYDQSTKIGNINLPKKFHIAKKNPLDFEELSIYKQDYFISNEANHKIYRYKNGDLNTEPKEIAIPEWDKDLSYNKGIEAFSIDKIGKFLAIAEYNALDESSTSHKGYLWTTDETYDKITYIKEFEYISDKNYGVSGVTFLDNKSALVLERKYSKKWLGFAEDYEIKVKYITNDMFNNKQVKGQTIIEINNNNINGKYGYADNFESIAVKEHGNSIKLYLLTDDNRAPFQRTTMLEFELSGEELSGMQVKESTKLTANTNSVTDEHYIHTFTDLTTPSSVIPFRKETDDNIPNKDTHTEIDFTNPANVESFIEKVYGSNSHFIDSLPPSLSGNSTYDTHPFDLS